LVGLAFLNAKRLKNFLVEQVTLKIPTRVRPFWER